MTEPRFNSVNTLPNDTDNQIAGSNSNVSQTEYGLVKVGSIIYAATANGVIQINQDGSYNQTIVSGFVGVGIVVNPVNGHLLVSDDNTSVYDVNPIAKTFSVFASGLSAPDGLTITPDGSTLYEADFYSGSIYAFSTSTKAKTLVASGLSLADGISLGYGSIANKLFVNCGTGKVYQIDLANNSAVTLIASGGSRGDFVVPDPNGTLLLTQTDKILRLTAPPPGGRFDMAKTTLTLTSSKNPSQSGDSVTFTAHVVAQGTSAIPTGTVTFTQGTDAVPVQTVQLDATGTATYTTTFYIGSSAGASTIADMTIGAQYSGDSADYSSSASITQEVVRQASEPGPGGPRPPR